MGTLSWSTWWAIGFVTAANLSFLAFVFGVWVLYPLGVLASVLVFVFSLRDYRAATTTEER